MKIIILASIMVALGVVTTILALHQIYKEDTTYKTAMANRIQLLENQHADLVNQHNKLNDAITDAKVDIIKELIPLENHQEEMYKHILDAEATAKANAKKLDILLNIATNVVNNK